MSSVTPAEARIQSCRRPPDQAGDRLPGFTPLQELPHGISPTVRRTRRCPRGRRT